MRDAFVAVVIPAYNAEETVGAAVQSVLAQGWPGVEVVVVDDGSTDGTAAVAEACGGRVRVLRLSNGGPARARNAGMRATEGEFVAFLDADDVWLPGKLEAQMPEFADAEVGLVFCDFSLQRAEGNSLPSYMAERPLAGGGWILERYLQSRFLFPSTIVARRAAVEQAGMFHEGLRGAEDLELFARMAAHWKVGYRSEVLVARVEGPGNLSADRALMIGGMVKAFRSIARREPGLSARERTLLREQLGQHLWWSGCLALQRGERARGRRELWESIRTTPVQTLRSAARLVGSRLGRGWGGSR